MRARARARCARFETAFHDRCSSWRSFEASTESAFQTVVRYLHCISIRCESELIIHGYILTCRMESFFYYASVSFCWSIHELWIIFSGTKRFYVMSTTTSIFFLYIVLMVTLFWSFRCILITLLHLILKWRYSVIDDRE